MRIRTLMISAVALLLALIPKVYATDEVNVLEFPNRLGEMLGIPLFAAQLLASTILLALFLFPTLLLTKNILAHLSIGLMVFGFCVAIGWLPVWIFIIFCLFLGLMYAEILADAFGTGGGAR